MDKEYLKETAKLIHGKLPDNYGFILLAFPFNKGGDGRLVYVSNTNRTDALNAMKEWILKCGASEDWMKHIK